MRISIVRQGSSETIFDNDSIQLGDYTIKRHGRRIMRLGDLSGREMTIHDLKEIFQGASVKPAGDAGAFPFGLSKDEDRIVYMEGTVALDLVLKGLFQALPDSATVRVE